MKACIVVILAANALLLLTESKSISQPSKAKRTKRSSWGDPYKIEKRDELLNALNGLERSRRRFEPEPGNQYLNPMAYLFDESLTDRDEYNESPVYQLGKGGRDDEEEFTMPKKSEYTPYRTYPRPADMAELENILASPSKAKAKRPDWGSSEESDLDSNYLQEEDVGDVEENEDEVNAARAQLTREQLESLLQKAEQYEKMAVEKEKADAVDTQIIAEPVSNEELENVLAGDEGKKEEAFEAKQPETKEVVNQEEDLQSDSDSDDFGNFSPKMAEINKEWLINQYLKAAGEEASKKHKRVAKRPMDESPVDLEYGSPVRAEEEENESAENAAAGEDARYTKKDLENLVEEYAIENKLISKENEYLATALNAATLGQIEKTDRYLGQQYKALQSAVKVEEALQDITKAEADEESEEESLVEEEKRFSRKNDVEEVSDDLLDEMPVSEVEAFPAKDEKGQWFDGTLSEGFDLVDEDSPGKYRLLVYYPTDI
jgi:hypothetical protein